MPGSPSPLRYPPDGYFDLSPTKTVHPKRTPNRVNREHPHFGARWACCDSSSIGRGLVTVRKSLSHRQIAHPAVTEIFGAKQRPIPAKILTRRARFLSPTFKRLFRWAASTADALPNSGAGQSSIESVGLMARSELAAATRCAGARHSPRRVVDSNQFSRHGPSAAVPASTATNQPPAMSAATSPPSRDGVVTAR